MSNLILRFEAEIVLFIYQCGDHPCFHCAKVLWTGHLSAISKNLGNFVSRLGPQFKFMALLNVVYFASLDLHIPANRLRVFSE